MKKGFTIVELIVSFSFIMIVCVFLFQIVINLKNLYVGNGLKTEMLNRQSILSNLINEPVIDYSVYNITSCGNGCLEFEYMNGMSNELVINKEELSIKFGNYKTKFPNGTKIGDISLDVIKVATFDITKNNSILKLVVPITNEQLKEQNFNITMFYQYNSNKSYINIED